jgi:hypothetical protein
VVVVNGLTLKVHARYAMTRRKLLTSLSATTKGQTVTRWNDLRGMDASFFQPSDGGDQ